MPYLIPALVAASLAISPVLSPAQAGSVAPATSTPVVSVQDQSVTLDPYTRGANQVSGTIHGAEQVLVALTPSLHVSATVSDDGSFVADVSAYADRILAGQQIGAVGTDGNGTLVTDPVAITVLGSNADATAGAQVDPVSQGDKVITGHVVGARSAVYLTYQNSYYVGKIRPDGTFVISPEAFVFAPGAELTLWTLDSDGFASADQTISVQ